MNNPYKFISGQLLELGEQYHQTFHAYWDFRKETDLNKLSEIRNKILSWHKVLIDLVNNEYATSKPATEIYMYLSVSIQPFNYCQTLNKNTSEKMYKSIIEGKYKFTEDVKDMVVESESYPLKNEYDLKEIFKKHFNKINENTL